MEGNSVWVKAKSKGVGDGPKLVEVIRDEKGKGVVEKEVVEIAKKVAAQVKESEGVEVRVTADNAKEVIAMQGVEQRKGPLDILLANSVKIDPDIAKTDLDKAAAEDKGERAVVIASQPSKELENVASKVYSDNQLAAAKILEKKITDYIYIGGDAELAEITEDANEFCLIVARTLKISNAVGAYTITAGMAAYSMWIKAKSISDKTYGKIVRIRAKNIKNAVKLKQAKNWFTKWWYRKGAAKKVSQFAAMSKMALSPFKMSWLALVNVANYMFWDIFLAIAFEAPDDDLLDIDSIMTVTTFLLAPITMVSDAEAERVTWLLTAFETKMRQAYDV